MTQSDYGDLDDHSRFDRPRRRTRPRTKDHPSYDDAATGFVVTIDRGRYTTRVDGESPHIVSAMKARALGRKGVVVGDRVRLVGDVSGDRPGMLDVKGRAKYDAWAKRKGVSKDAAMEQYIALVGKHAK